MHRIRIIAAANILLGILAIIYLMLHLQAAAADSRSAFLVPLFLLVMIIVANIGILQLKEWGRKIFLVLLWFTVLLLNVFLIFQTAPFLMDTVAREAAPTAVAIYLALLIPCALQIVFFSRTPVLKIFRNRT